MTSFEPVELTAADLQAFARRHPHIDRAMTQRTLATPAPGQRIVEQREQREIFSFNAPELGDLLFDVRGIKDALAARRLSPKMLMVTMDEEWVGHLRAHGGVEVEHMARLTAADLERPGIAVFWPNGYTTVIDGNNRIVRRWDDGLRSFRMARITIGMELEPFICRPGDEEKFFTPLADDPNEYVVSLRKEIVRR